VTEELWDDLAADDAAMTELCERLAADDAAMTELCERLAADDAAMTELCERLAAEPDPFGPEYWAALAAADLTPEVLAALEAGSDHPF
jgi:hypothetical protein